MSRVRVLSLNGRLSAAAEQAVVCSYVCSKAIDKIRITLSFKTTGIELHIYCAEKNFE